MKISVLVYYDNSATVTCSPSWIARLLLGRQETTRAVYSVAYASGSRWFYSETHREVGRRIADAIERTMTLRAVRARHEKMVRR